MATNTFHPVFKFSVLAVFICSCGAATVQFYMEHDFKGAVYEATSSTNCKILPLSFQNVNGSVKTDGCIALYQNLECNDSHSWAHVIKSEVAQPNENYYKYKNVKYSEVRVSSFRDCTTMERRPQVDLDHFEFTDFKGKMTQYRDICTCINLPSHSSSVSIKQYGNCFKLYKTANCVGEPFEKNHRPTWYRTFVSWILSIEPCHLPQLHCKVIYSGNIFRIQSIAHNQSSIPEISFQTVPIISKQTFINYGGSTIERIFEAYKYVTETFHFQLLNAIHPINTIRVDSQLTSDFGLTNASDSSFMTEIQNRLTSEIQAQSQSNSNETIAINHESKRELRVRESFTLSPCTKLEVRWLAEMGAIETDCSIHLRVTGTTRETESPAQLDLDNLPYVLNGLKFTEKQDNFTALAETYATMKFNHISKTWVEVTTVSIPNCRKKFINLQAHVLNISPTTNVSNLGGELQKVPVANTQSFINNGATQQEKHYQAKTEHSERIEFQFTNEINQISSIAIDDDTEINNVQSPEFLKRAWAELKTEILKKEHNVTVHHNPLDNLVNRNKTYAVQEKVIVSPCHKYEVNSFVEMAENLEVVYQVQLGVTGQLGSEAVEADEIQELLKELTFVRKEDNFTVVIETTGKLQLNYVVNSGVVIFKTKIPNCRSRFIKYTGNVVNLERISNSSNSTGTSNLVAIAPKLVFVNNGTSQQEDIYEAAKEITEAAKFEFENDMIVIAALKFDEGAKKELEKSILFSPAIWTELENGLTRSGSNWNDTVLFEVNNKNEFHVQKNIVVAPCTRYEVDSFIEMRENEESTYRVLLEVTGKLGADLLVAEDVRDGLKQIKILRNKDDFTVIVETTMKLKVDYGTSSGVNAEGKQMLECLAVQAELVGNCKFVCSG